MNPAPCEAPEALRRLIDGELKPDEQSRVEAHVQGCRRCQEALDRIDRDEALVWHDLGPDDSHGSARRAGLLDFPSGPPVPSPHEPIALDVQELDGYVIRSPLGSGTMGTVYLAYERRLDRQVALKLPRPDLAAIPGFTDRFLREARAAAAGVNDHIVRIHHVGDASDDFPLPYLVMEYVEGGTLAHRLEGGRSLTPDAAAEIVRQVARGLEAAHALKLVHRDVKPSNILIEAATGRAKLADFGLARAVNKLDPVLTRDGALVGSPAYVSPEQVSGGITVDARSDLFGLGVVLYEMLTGSRPFQGPSTESVLHQVVYHEPVSPRRLVASVPRDLETICIKCLEKEPRRRYESASELAEDLRRYLGREPTLARPPSPVGRLAKWARRQPWAAACVAACLLAAFLLAAGASWHNTRLLAELAETTKARRATERALGQLQLANTELTVASAKVTRANSDLQASNEREHLRFALAMEAIKVFHSGVSEDLLLKEKQFVGLRTKLLKSAAVYYEKLEGQLKGQPDPASQTALGQAYHELGTLTSKIDDKSQALVMHRKALAVRRELADKSTAESERALDMVRSLHEVGRVSMEIGDMTAALEAFEEAKQLADRRARVGASSERDAARALLGWGHILVGNQFYFTGNHKDALKSYENAIAAFESLVEANPNVAQFKVDLAAFFNNIGLLLLDTGHAADALVAENKALAIREALVEANPNDSRLQHFLGTSRHNTGIALRRVGRPAEAFALFKGALLIREALMGANPAVTEFQNYVGGTHLEIGSLLLELGKPAEALAALETAQSIWGPLAKANPAIVEFHNDLAMVHAQRSMALADMGKAPEAVAAIENGLKIRESLASGNPSMPSFQIDLIRDVYGASGTFLKLGRPDDARAAAERAVMIVEKLLGERPTNVAYRRELGISYLRLGSAHSACGDVVRAVHDTRRAITIYEALPVQSAGDLYNIARCRAALVRLASSSSSALSAEAKMTEADRAMHDLQKAVAVGYGEFSNLRTDADLDPLRHRSDFQLMLMDLSMPANVFARP
jgi:eukaryotic-like serine/threonine-protein kinase